MKPLLLLLLALAAPSTGATSGQRPGHGLIGYGITMYDPACAYACQSSIPTTLDCPDSSSSSSSMSSDDDMDMDMDSPSPECLTTYPPYLRSLAWCIHSHCPEDMEVYRLEKWWVMNVAGTQTVQPEPNVSYQEAVRQVSIVPTEVLGDGDMLNRTVMVDEETYVANYNIDVVFPAVERNHETYGLVLFISGSLIPIILSLLRLLPFPHHLSVLLAAHFSPPLLGTNHASPSLLHLANVPTRGQSLFLVYLFVLNIALCCVGYPIASPNSWYSSDWYQLASYVADRTGVLAFANVALLVLYSGRNSPLVYLTNWSRSTLLLVHRWVAWLCVLQTCVHSAVWLGLYVYDHAHTAVSKEPFWYWGIIATLALVVLLPLSILPIRKAAYEAFLCAHVFFAILAIAGSWYHIVYRYDHQWGYETWLYVAMAAWAFDRLVRLARMARMGTRRAHVSRVDDDYLRIDVPGVDCAGHVYAYFPGLTWRVWENHPFSVVKAVGATPTSTPNKNGSSPDKVGTSTTTKETGSAASETTASLSGTAPRGITLFVRTQAGLTAKLASAISRPAGIPILLEGSYGNPSSNLLNTSHAPSTAYPNTLCIAGGVGITAILPSLHATLNLYAPTGTTKLFWGVRQPGLVAAVEGLVGDVRASDEDPHVRFWGRVETHVALGERMNLRTILDREVGEPGSPGTTVVVCGPGSMADEVRCIVSGLGRHGAAVRLVEESFTW